MNEQDNTIMSWIDYFKGFLKFDTKNELGPSGLPRDVEDDLKHGSRRKHDSNLHESFQSNFAEDNHHHFSFHHSVDEEFKRMFQDMDNLFQNFFGDNSNFHFHQEFPRPTEHGNQQEKSLRDKMLDGDQKTFHSDQHEMMITPFESQREDPGNTFSMFFRPPSLFHGFFHSPFDHGFNQNSETMKEDDDLDDDVTNGRRSIDDILKYDAPDELSHGNHVILPFGSNEFEPKRSDMASAFKSSTFSRKINPDGSIETHSTKRDSDGNEEVVVSRSFDEQTHTVTSRKNHLGEEEKTEDFLNMDKDDLSKFEEKWQKNKPGPRERLLTPYNEQNQNANKYLTEFFSSWWKPKL